MFGRRSHVRVGIAQLGKGIDEAVAVRERPGFELVVRGVVEVRVVARDGEDVHDANTRSRDDDETQDGPEARPHGGMVTVRPAAGRSNAVSASDVIGDEAVDLGDDLGVLRCTEEPSVGHRLPHVELGVDTGGAETTVQPNCVGQQDVAGARLQERGWETVEVTEHRRQVRIPEVVSLRVQRDEVRDPWTIT